MSGESAILVDSQHYQGQNRYKIAPGWIVIKGKLGAEGYEHILGDMFICIDC